MSPFDHYWWQCGPLTSCGHGRAFLWCVADNIRHSLYVKRLMLRRRTGWRWICPRIRHATWLTEQHDRAVLAAAKRKWGEE